MRMKQSSNSAGFSVRNVLRALFLKNVFNLFWRDSFWGKIVSFSVMELQIRAKRIRCKVGNKNVGIRPVGVYILSKWVNDFFYGQMFLNCRVWDTIWNCSSHA